MLPTIITAAVLCFIVGLVVAFMIRNKIKNKGSCCCGCSGCAMKDKCHGENK